MLKRIFIVLCVALALPVGAATAAAADDNPAVFRPNEWHLRDSLSSGPSTTLFRFGRAGDTPLLCDWNGDGVDTPGVVRERPDGRWQWYIRNDHAGGIAEESFVYGRSPDRVVCGNWDGQGGQGPGVVRERANRSLEWHLRNSLSSGPADISFVYGRNFNADETIPTHPLAGDWDNSGSDTPGLAVGRADGRFEWHLRTAAASGPADIRFVYYGGAVWGDHLEVHVPFVGDWNGDGEDTPGVVRGQGGGNYRWLLREANASGPADVSFVYGRHLDSPLVWGSGPL